MASADGLRRTVRGLSEAAFRERFGTEEACGEALFAMRWREGLTCPACGGASLCRLRTRKVFQCNRCERQLSLTAGTVFQDSKLPLTVWLAAIYQLTRAKGGISSIELARRLGVRQPTAWPVKHELMRAMAARDAAKPRLSGRVEVDDAYLGGERPGGERGRGAAGKTPTVAAVEATAERRPRRLRLAVVEGFRKREVERLAKAAIEPGATVVSDGLSCRPAVGKAGCGVRREGFASPGRCRPAISCADRLGIEAGGGGRGRGIVGDVARRLGRARDGTGEEERWTRARGSAGSGSTRRPATPAWCAAAAGSRARPCASGGAATGPRARPVCGTAASGRAPRPDGRSWPSRKG